jgi:hypothetical protein
MPEQSPDTVEHVPHSSADYDDMEYVDDRGIRIFDESWTCPNCGDDGKLMFRPGSKNTCTECFWVLNGRYNDYVLDDWPLKYRHAQALLAERGDNWHGTPGSVSTALRKYFDRPEEADQAWREHTQNEAVADGGPTGVTLGDFT